MIAPLFALVVTVVALASVVVAVAIGLMRACVAVEDPMTDERIDLTPTFPLEPR